jgi:RNA polymerase sigma factor (sigma-70 family)
MAAATLNVFLRRLKRGLATGVINGLSDQELLQQFLAQGDESAFEVIVHRHGPMVLRVCWRALRQTQDAEDAFQATFLLLARKARSVRKQDSLASWLHGVAHRVSLQAQARWAIQRRHEGRVVPCGGGSPDDVTWGELRSLLDEELHGLPEKWRLPLILCYLQAKTQDEAAGQLKWSPRTFRRRLEEARAVLGRRLARRGVALSVALGAHLLFDCMATAAISPSLMASVVDAAARVAAGQTAAGIVSASVTALTEGVVQAMFTSKLKAIFVVLMLVGAFSVGAWLFVAESLALQPQESKPGTKASAKPEGTAKDKADGPRELPVDKINTDKVITVIQEQVLSAALAGDSKFVITVTAPPFDVQGVKETTIKAWDAKSGELKRTIREGKFDYYRVALSPSAKLLLVGSPRNKKDAELYDIADLTNEPRLIHTLANSANAWSVAFASNGKALLIGTTDGSVKAYDAKSGEQKWSKNAHDGHVSFVAFSKDGKHVVSAGTDKTVQIRDAADGSLTSTLEGHTKQVTSASFSPDGKFIASGGYDGTVRIWDVGTAKVVHKIDVADTSVRSLAFSPDGKTLVIGGLKNVGQTVLGLWNVKTGQQVKELSGHQGGAFSVAFSADGTIVMSAGGDGGVGLWRLTPAKK